MSQKMPPGMVERLIIIGTGLMGASLAARVKERKLAAQIIGVDAQSAKDAQAAAMIDVACATLSEVDEGHGLTAIVVATPISAIDAVFAQIERFSLAQPVAWITDLCSTKADVVRASSLLTDCRPRLVCSHPMAGSEKQGVQAANAALYDQARVLISPLDATSDQVLGEVEAFWLALGTQPTLIPVQDHDALLASISHLPHALAYSLAATLADSSLAAMAQTLHGGGLRDTTRVAASSPALWADILLANRDELLAVWSQWQVHQEMMKDALTQKDRDLLIEMLTRAAHWRKGF